MVISKYGDESLGDVPLTVRYQRAGEDVGHYDCLLTIINQSFEQVNTSETGHSKLSAIIQGISSLPKRLPDKTKRTRKVESAAILTSSSYGLK